MLDPQWMTWSSLPLSAWLRWLGLTLVVCSGLLLVWTFRNLGRNVTDTVVTRKDHTLVTSGPYRYMRHPFYVAFALGVLGGAWRWPTGSSCWRAFSPADSSWRARGSGRRSWS